MTDDFVKRLRQYSDVKLPNEAADRIERLQAALRWIIEQEKQTAHPTVCAIVKAARKALEGKDD